MCECADVRMCECVAQRSFIAFSRMKIAGSDKHKSKNQYYK